MKVILFGASGMIGGGVLRECLDDPKIDSVLAVGRSSCGLTHPKLRELIHADLFDLGAVAEDLEGYDVCFYCLGVSAMGMGEAEYRRITVDLTKAVVDVLLNANPDLKLCFVSGQGTDGTGRSRMMWARVKGEAENWLLSLPIEAYMFRPGFIQPMKGVRSKTALYQALYTILAPVSSLLLRLFPASMSTTVSVGRAMIATATRGYHKPILETSDINALAAADRTEGDKGE